MPLHQGILGGLAICYSMLDEVSVRYSFKELQVTVSLRTAPYTLSKALLTYCHADLCPMPESCLAWLS